MFASPVGTTDVVATDFNPLKIKIQKIQKIRESVAEKTKGKALNPAAGGSVSLVTTKKVNSSYMANLSKLVITMKFKIVFCAEK